jgi:hypothetical protein
MSVWLSNLRRRSLAVRLLALTLAVVAPFAIVGPLAEYLGGPAGLAAAGVAAIACLIGAVTALVVSSVLSGTAFALAALMAGMAARMGMPLGLGLLVHLQGGPLAKAGLLYYLLIFYPITLMVETVLSLPSTERPQSSQPETLHT